MRACVFASLCAALAVSAASAQDVPTLLPAEPVAPTRTERMAVPTTGLDFGGVPILAVGPGTPAAGGDPACPPTASRRRLFDGTCLQMLQAILYRSRVGVASSLTCNCFAAERNFMFGGCRAYFRPGLECTSCGLFGQGRFGPIEYGIGARGTAPACDTHAPATGLPAFR